MKKNIRGYHGTARANVPLITRNGFRIEKYSFLTSALQKIPGDLGAGAYAYKDNPQNAEKFAEKFGDDIAVLKLTLEVEEEYYLDMDEEDNASLVLDIYNSKVFKSLKQRYERTHKSARNRECLDGLILEHIIHKHKIRVDLVKKNTYTRFKDLPPISQYHNGTELCIKSGGIIKEIEEHNVSNTCRSDKNGN